MASDNKYDRQIRLWGVNGQRKLGQSSILLIGAEPAGVEALKNLVLPGLGHFCIIDNKFISQKDLGNNFMVSETHINQSRAKIVCELIQEINEDVKGDYKDDIPEPQELQQFIEYNKFQLVICNEQNDTFVKEVSIICQKLQIKLVVVQTYGMIGALQIQGNQHLVLENKPEEGRQEDLRISEPFEELVQFCDSFDMQSLDTYQKSHVPYVVILIKTLQKWKSENNNNLPKSQNEKQRFKQSIGCFGSMDFENIIEATKFYYKCFQSQENLEYSFSNIHDLFIYIQQIQQEHQDLNSIEFLFSRGLYKFFNLYKRLPVTGNVSDMASLTTYYNQLRQIYKQKALKDQQIIRKIIDDLIHADSTKIITDDQLTDLCVKSQQLQILSYKPIYEVLNGPKYPEFFENDIHEWYFLLRACEIFYQNNNHYPTFNDQHNLMSILHQIQGNVQVQEKKVHEMCRYQNSKLHNIAAILGGITAQECVKLITQQFIPLKNTFIYSGISSEAVQLDL